MTTSTDHTSPLTFESVDWLIGKTRDIQHILAGSTSRETRLKLTAMRDRYIAEINRRTGLNTKPEYYR